MKSSARCALFPQQTTSCVLLAIYPVKLEPVAEYTLTYEFYDNAVSVKIDYEFASYAKYPPRVGLVAALDKKFDRVRYYGYGPGAAYIDRRISCVKDVYESSVGGLMERYVKPQEKRQSLRHGIYGNY